MSRTSPRAVYPAWRAAEGELHFRNGDFKAARSVFEEALKLGPAPGDQELFARRLERCGGVDFTESRGRSICEKEQGLAW